MKSALLRRPSASMVVAMIALVMAASGTAVAAGRLVSGDNVIKRGSLSGNRLRNHTITGSELNMKELGTVPRAATAINANELGGLAPSAFLSSSSLIGTQGIVSSSGSINGTTVALFVTGPFTVTMTCTKSSEGDVSLALEGSSSEPNSVIDGAVVSTANQAVDLPNAEITNGSTSVETQNASLGFEAPSGAAATLFGTSGINSLGADCWSHWVGLS